MKTAKNTRGPGCSRHQRVKEVAWGELFSCFSSRRDITMLGLIHKVMFSRAPALYSFNVPKYFAILLRAREFAKQQNVQLTWCYARDIPLHPGDRDLKKEALDQKRIAWLQRHARA